MKSGSLGAAIAVLCAGAPAFATQSLDCRSIGRPALRMFVSVGSGGGVDLVTIVEGGRELRATGLSGANPRIVHGRMDDAGTMIVRIAGRESASISVRSTRRSYLGRLNFRGRRWPIDCYWEMPD